MNDISVVALRLVELSKVVGSFRMFGFLSESHWIFVKMISNTIYSNIFNILRERYVHRQHQNAGIYSAL